MKGKYFKFSLLVLCVVFWSNCHGNNNNNKSINGNINTKEVELKKTQNGKILEDNRLVSPKLLDLSQYKVVVSDNPSKVEINAANQLIKYLKKFGLNQIAKEGERISGGRIFIGDTHAFKNKLGTIVQYVGRDGIVIKFIEDDIYIHGERDRAILYATYEFLERNIGIRFWSPKIVDYPSVSNIQLAKIDYEYTPPFFYRSEYSNNANTDKEFAIILKENGDSQPTDANWGAINKILGWSHTFNTILPYSIYGKVHPEWFIDPNTNKPMKAYNPKLNGLLTQPYLYNKEMKKQFLKNTLEWIAKNPDYEIISISQNDNKIFTKSFDNSLNSSDILLSFLNDISKEIIKLYPSKKIETLAYHATEIPPKKIKTGKNLIVRLAPITSNMGYSYQSKYNVNPYSRFMKWMEVDTDFFYWGYNTNFRFPFLPYPGFERLQSDLALLKTHKFKGVFFLDNLNKSGYFQDMKSWVLAKMMWNPELNQESLIREFFDGYYKEASKPLYEYYKLVEKQFHSTPRILAAYQEDYKFLDDKEFLNKSTELFNQALKSAKSNDLRNKINNEKYSFELLNAYLGKRNKNQVNELLEKFKGNVVDNLEKNNLRNFEKVLNTQALK